MTPEGKVKAAIKRLLVEQGVWYFMPPANGYGRTGIPDFVCCVNGKFLAIEAKANTNPTTLKERELAGIHAHGGVAMVIKGDTPDNLEHGLNNLMNAILRLKETP